MTIEINGKTLEYEFATDKSSGERYVVITKGLVMDGTAIIPTRIDGIQVTSIGEGAFCGCSGLESVTIGTCVMRIGRHAFSGCSGLTSMTIPEGACIAGSVFEDCEKLERIHILDFINGAV